MAQTQDTTTLLALLLSSRDPSSLAKNIIEKYDTAAMPCYTVTKSHKQASISYFFSFCLVMCTKSGNQAMRTITGNVIRVQITLILIFPIFLLPFTFSKKGILSRKKYPSLKNRREEREELLTNFKLGSSLKIIPSILLLTFDF